MRATKGILYRRLSYCAWHRALIAAIVFLSVAVSVCQVTIRYLRFEEVQETLRLNAGSGLPGSEIQESAAWNDWIRARDAEVRGRIDRGIEDSISNLILYGTSFTTLPRVDTVEDQIRSEEHTSELQSRQYLVCRLLLEKKKIKNKI